MTSPSRRRFLQTAVAAGAVYGLSGAPAAAIEPIRRVGKPNIRLSCAAYSYRKYLDLKKKPKPDLDLDGFIELCAEMGLDAVELTAYYFAQTTPEYLARHRKPQIRSARPAAIAWPQASRDRGSRAPHCPAGS